MGKIFSILTWAGLGTLYLTIGFFVWIVSSIFENFFELTNNKYMIYLLRFQNENETVGWMSSAYMVLFWPLHLLLGFIFKFIK